MGRERVNPFDQGTPERVLYDRWRKASSEAAELEKRAALDMTEARAKRSSADRYADALRALGHGDKVPGQRQLPNYAAVGSAGDSDATAT